jgi:hypothetical protein
MNTTSKQYRISSVFLFYSTSGFRIVTYIVIRVRPNSYFMQKIKKPLKCVKVSYMKYLILLKIVCNQSKDLIHVIDFKT